MGRAARARRRPGRPKGVSSTSAWHWRFGWHPRAGRHPRFGGRTGARRPRRHSRCPRRVHRRRCVLRAERIPDHLAASRRTRPHRRDRPARVLGAPRPTAAARVDRRGDGGRRAARAVPVQRGRRRARRRGRRLLLGGQLGLRVPPHGLLHAGRPPVAAAAHLVARGGGAVLRRVATGARCRRRTARLGHQAPGHQADAAHGPDGRRRHRRRGCGGIGGRGVPDGLRRVAEPCLLRHRHPRAGAARRRGGGSAFGAGLVVAGALRQRRSGRGGAAGSRRSSRSSG